jgi:hypothetical protein
MNEDLIPRHVLSPGRMDLLTRELLARIDESARPRPGQRPSRPAIAALAASACVAAAGVATVSLLSPPAWAADSDALTGAALRSTQLDCTTRLSRLPNAGRLGRTADAVAEKRGSTSSALLFSGSALGVCIGSEGQRYGAVVDLPARPTSASPVTVGLAATVVGAEPTGVVAGRVGADIASVTLKTTDGRSMQATTRDGYFLAWWPSAARPDSLTALRADRSVVATLDADRLTPVGPPDAVHS